MTKKQELRKDLKRINKKIDEVEEKIKNGNEDYSDYRRLDNLEQISISLTMELSRL